MKTTTITIPNEALEELLLPYLEAWKAEYYATLPATDPQYTLLEVAEILHVTPETVRHYLKLLAIHPQHPQGLPYVNTTDSARGYRVLLSDIRAWQLRNRFPIDDDTLELPVRRPARRRH
jgi:hypothetical protein